MAAPSVRMASRPLLRFINYVGQAAVRKTCVRQVSLSYAYCATLKTHSQTERVASPWKLMGAVCLQRLPVISQDRNPIEEQFSELMHRMEFERSLFSDHEMRLLEDAERMSRKQADDYDSDEEDDHGQEIVLAQDLEDQWEQRLKLFQPAARGEERDLSSPDRCLADALILLAEQEVGSETLWMLPQAQWQAGETLRQTAERALASLPENDFKATFLGNAPCGFYKYKLPAAARTESLVGVKVFFFKAILTGGGPALLPNKPFKWLKKSELQGYLKEAYLDKVSRFVINL